MKLILPSNNDMVYIKNQLKDFCDYNYKYRNEQYPVYDKPVIMSLKKLCMCYNIKTPKKIKWCKKLDNGKTLGKCSEDGTLKFIDPIYFPGDMELWVATFFHEFGHYILWANAEDKANEYEDKMMKKWRKC